MKKLIAKIKAWLEKILGKAVKDESPAPAPQPVPVSPAPTPVELPPRVAPQFPQIVERNGARYKIVAPLAEDWVGSGFDAVWFPAAGPSYCDENDGSFRISKPAGARSPRGYPLRDGQVLFAGHLFADDDAVAAYVAAVAERDANLAEWARRWGRTYNKPKFGIKAVEMSMDDCFALDALAEQYQAVRNASSAANNVPAFIHWLVVEGQAVEVNRVINFGSYERTHLFSLDAYNGPVKAAVAEIIAQLKATGTVPLPESFEVEYVNRQARWETEALEWKKSQGLI